MKNIKKLLALILAIAIACSMAATLSACNDDTDPTEDTQGASGSKVTYTIAVESAGGMKMEGIQVYVYADDTLDDLVQAGQTDANGKVQFEMPQSGKYAITLDGAPKGYKVEKSYGFKGTAAEIALTSSLITEETLGNAGNLKLGDVMYDFSYTLPDGTTKKLSEVLKEKDMVLLNFWFAQCGPCGTEFPYMEQAYQMYKDDAAVIALSYIDSNADVAVYQSSMGLTFDMAECSTSWPGIFGFNSFPSTVVIDRYGVISLIEVGALTSLRPFTSIFDHFCGDDYEQKLCVNGVNDVITTVKPTQSMPSSEEIGQTINQGQIQVTYRPETQEGAAEHTWPFVIGEKNGEKCIMASNSHIDGSFAMIYADVELKAGEAVGFDYLISSERGADTFVVIVDGNDIFQMSGYDEVETWKKCYPWVADEDGTYEVVLCYLKDEGTDVGDDTVYVKNLRVVDADDVDTETYLPREAATTEDGFTYNYVDIVLNEKDGYYHVGTANGPLLLANLMGYSQFSEEDTVWNIVYSGAAKDYYQDMVSYFSYASNSAYNGYCTVNEELMGMLKLIDQVAGFDDEDDKEWMKICTYYQAYGTDKQLEDPIKGLATFSAFKATEGKNVPTNCFTYNRIIMPRGMFAAFTPSRSGVYRITSRNESQQGVEGWIFDENKTELLVFEHDERMFEGDGEVSMVYYMEAGKTYYIDIAFYDLYENGTIYYDIEYIGSTYELFRLCAPGYFTYDTDATGSAMYHLITGGIDVVLGNDGYYYEDLGNGKKGSKIYADFEGLTPLFSNPIATVNTKDADGNPLVIKGLIELGGFDFSKTEEDLQILAYMAKNNNDPKATDAYLKNLWGDDYEANKELYQIEDVFAGKYHGKGVDLTDEIEAYLDKIITTGSEERRGCVPVDAKLAELLQKLMDKYTFADVDHSWTKMCYYYDYLGPEG